MGFPQTAWQYALLERGLSGYTAPDLQPKTTLDVPPAARHFAKFETDFLLGWCWLNTWRAWANPILAHVLIVVFLLSPTERFC